MARMRNTSPQIRDLSNGITCLQFRGAAAGRVRHATDRQAQSKKRIERAEQAVSIPSPSIAARNAVRIAASSEESYFWLLGTTTVTVLVEVFCAWSIQVMVIV